MDHYFEKACTGVHPRSIAASRRLGSMFVTRGMTDSIV